MHNVAVLIPYYKREAQLLETLESFRSEKQEFDVVVVDDGSPVPLKLDISAYPFPVHVIVLPQNQGIEHALNAGLKFIFEKDYEFTARMDTGDFWIPGRLDAQRDFLNSHPDYGLVGCAAEIVGPDGRFIRNWDLPYADRDIRNFIFFNNAFVHPAVMMRTRVLRQAGFYSDKYEAAEDYEYFRRILKYTKAENLRARLLRYEIGLPGQSITVDKHSRQIKSVIAVQLRYFNPLNWRTYAGLAYKLMHLYVPGLARGLKKIFRRKY